MTLPSSFTILSLIKSSKGSFAHFLELVRLTLLLGSGSGHFVEDVRLQLKIEVFSVSEEENVNSLSVFFFPFYFTTSDEVISIIL